MASDSKTVDISDLDKFDVLKALWENSKTASFFAMMPQMAPKFSDGEARELLARDRAYVDYLCGRVIKTDFSKNTLDPWGYDRDNGQGSMQNVVNGVRAQKGA
jgi:hypothetical protein